jgi:hypothetical protein
MKFLTRLEIFMFNFSFLMCHLAFANCFVSVRVI